MRTSLYPRRKRSERGRQRPNPPEWLWRSTIASHQTRYLHNVNLEIRTYRDADDLGLFLSIPYALNHEVADDLGSGRRRPEWMWLAIQNGTLAGRLALWGPSGALVPTQLDIFDTDISLPKDDQRQVAAALLEAARHTITSADSAPEFARYLPATWRDDPCSRLGTEVLIDALEASGARFVVERIRMEGPTVTSRLRTRD